MGTSLVRDLLHRMISGFGHVSDYPGGKRSFLPGGRRDTGGSPKKQQETG
jgi:hypothetical protein